MTTATLGQLIDGLQERAAAAVILHRDPEPEVWSGTELATSARRLAAGLRQRGLAHGEVVGLLAPNSPEWVVAFFAVVRAGAIAMPLSDQLTPGELGRIVAHSGCRRLFVAAEARHLLDEIEGTADLELILLDEARDAPVAHWRDLASDDVAGLPELDPTDRAVLVYTSGTTGTPKGVPLRHANLAANIEALVAARLAGPDDRLLLPLPLYHTYPLTVGLLAPLATGAAVVMPGAITGPEIMRALAACRCTIMIGVPRLYEAMLSGIESQLKGRPKLVQAAYRRLLTLSIRLRRERGVRIGRHLFRPLHRRIGPELRLLASGGARLDPEVAWTLEGLGYEVLTGYGLTETAPILTFNPPGRARLDSAGLPVEGVELRIAPAEDTPPGEGEIQARGPNVFEGYWNNPQATAASFTEDGFFRTGDLGHLDADGYLHIAGRSKELIVLAGGKNVFPEDVEAVYGTSALIYEIAVLEQDGRLVGLIVPEAGALSGGDGKELGARIRGEIERLSAELPPYQRLSDFAITSEPLPRTQIGKLRRHLLAEAFARARQGADRGATEVTLSPQDRALLDSALLGPVWEWLNERFAPLPLTLDASPQLDLGMDSFDWMSLTMELGERFGVQLNEDAIARVATLRDLLREIEQAAEQAPERGAAAGELDPAQRRWLEPQGLVTRSAAAILFGLNRLIMRGLFRLRVEGLEHLPAEGPFLLTPNHASYLDPFAIGAALSWRELQRLYWAGWTGLLFRGPLTRLFSRVARVLPVDPERGLTSTLPLGRAALERGYALCWFPEGARSTDGRLHRFLPGVGLLLERTGVPAVPVWIEGSYEAWPPDRRLPRLRPLRIRFGRPLRFERGADGGSDRHREIADRLHDAVAALAAPSPASS